VPIEPTTRSGWISKAEFHSRLRRWYRETDESVIGDPDAHALTAWVWIRDGHLLARLNADTTRAAVAEYLALVHALHGNVPWSVVSSARGQPTKIAFGPDRIVLPAFHLYAEPGTVTRGRLG
jgi:hypothetical protein